MYYKGANLLHTIRQIINDDEKFRTILRGLNKDFYHQTVTSAQVEQYISVKSGKDFKKVFDQYLRTINVPVLEYKQAGKSFQFRWQNVVPGFQMPVRLANGNWLTPSAKWQATNLAGQEHFEVDKNFYIFVKKV
jgi:aminopeptidase N